MPEILLKSYIVGEEPVGFDNSTGILYLAGKEYTLSEWQTLEERINKLYERGGYIKDIRRNKSSDPNSGTSSFLTANLRQILDRDHGLIKDPPFYLKPFYSGVITKERLWEL